MKVHVQMRTESQAAVSLQSAHRSFSLGDFDAARESCRAVLRMFPGRAAALHLLGVMSLQEGDRPTAEDFLRRAAESPDTAALYLLSYAQLVCKATDQTAALALTRRAVAMQGNLPLGWFSLGDQLLDRREYAESRTCFERALELDAGLWQARAKLAVLLGRTGRVPEALGCFQQLLRDHAENAEAIGSYAAFLQDIGLYTEALIEAERAIVKSPDTLDHRLRAADIEMQFGRYGAALDRLEGTELRWPDDIRPVVLRATLLRLIDRYDDAVVLCRDALGKGRESAELLRTYASALHLAGEHDEAIDMLDRAAMSHPALALSDKALLLSQLGRLAEGSEAYDQALAREPALVDAWYNKTQTKTYGSRDPDIGAMETLLDGYCSARDRLLLHFALGKAYMDAENPEAAFGHWDRGNRMKRAITDYDAEATAQQLASIVTGSVDLTDPYEGSGARGARLEELPVFVVGMPRCGSSLVEQILASHPDVHGAGEQTRLRHHFQEDHTGSAQSIAESALGILRRFSTRAARIVDKDLINFRHLGAIHRIFPRARIIHCRRNPLDTCFSAYTKLFIGDFPFTYDQRELGLYYRQYHAVMAHWRSVLPSRIFMEVDYEAVVSAPLDATRRLVDFLGLSWNDACLRFFETRRTVNTASLAQVRQPIYRSSVGRSVSLLPYLMPLTEALGELASDA
jgi:tetratricopeptide (TPR) repeat protein